MALSVVGSGAAQPKLDRNQVRMGSHPSQEANLVREGFGLLLQRRQSILGDSINIHVLFKMLLYINIGLFARYL